MLLNLFVMSNLPKDLEKTKKFWSKGLGAKFYRKHSGKYFSRMHEYVTAELLSRNPEIILDVACGGGDFLHLIHTKVPNVNLFGTDVAPGMVGEAMKKLGDNAKISESRAIQQPFSDNTFDVVTIMMAFHHFQDKKETLIEIKRILKPNGVLMIFDVVARYNLQKKLWNWLEKMTGIRGYVDHYLELDLKRLSEQSGFANFTWCYTNNPG